MAIKDTPIAVLGCGSWGTALALLLARNGQDVILWGFDPKEVSQLSRERCNNIYLPGYPFPDNLSVVSELSDAVKEANDILIAVPSFGFRGTLTALLNYFRPEMRIAWATKGLDPKTNKLLHEVVSEVVGTSISTAVVSGPSFAKEVAAGMLTAVVVASQTAFGEDMKERLSSDVFSVRASRDLVGVQAGGIVKNVIAIATGISDGLGFGANARCALVTMGFEELVSLGLALGGRKVTLRGLSGIGDLVLTCTDDLSRNRRFGMALGQGKTPDEAKTSIGQVVEGAQVAGDVLQLADTLSVEMPITEKIYRILQGELTARDAMSSLFS